MYIYIYIHIYTYVCIECGSFLIFSRRVSADKIFDVRKKNAEEMERRLEMIPLTTLQLMTELDVWQSK